MNFIVYGALLVLFSLNCTPQSSRRGFARVGFLLLTIVGVAIFSSGLFAMDPAQTPFNELSWHGILHLVCALIVFSLLPVSCLVFFFAFYRESDWKAMRRWSAISLITILVTILSVYIPPSVIPSEIRSYGPWPGILNRVLVGAWLLWQFTFALALHRRHTEPGQLGRLASSS